MDRTIIKKDHAHLSLVCDIGELAALLTGSENIETFLQRTVEMVAGHMDADVCSIYLYDDPSRELILTATRGLNPEAIGKIRMKIGEGLVGLTLEKLEPTIEAFADRNPKFKYFTEAHEDRFKSFLSVPILRGLEKIGVLVVQHEKSDHFDELDIIVMRAIASQLAGVVGNARLLKDLGRKKDKYIKKPIPDDLQIIKGQVASPGYAHATVIVIDRVYDMLLDPNVEYDFKYTLKDFHRAIRATVDQITELQARFVHQMPESASLIFTAHLMILKDVRFVNQMENLIREGTAPMAAVKLVAERYVKLFSESPFVHIREKANDVKDLAGRILENFEPGEHDISLWGENRIVIARELYPSDVLKLASEGVKGIILLHGGITSHVSILAQSLQIPMIVADRQELLDLPFNTHLIMDAGVGEIYINPSESIIHEYAPQKPLPLDTTVAAKSMSSKTHTKDGVRIQLLANVNILRDLSLARELKAEGVGLYRSEFPFLIRSSVPSEEEQYIVYKQLFDGMRGKNVTIRTLDLGGKKMPAYAATPQEDNPDLGLRAIRFTLYHREMFRQQLRAILRAGSETETVSIMFPMISSLDEYQEAQREVYDCIDALQREDLAHHPKPRIGAMIELPCVLEIIDELANAVDFLSIGTNDFIQYMLAVDRGNEKVAHYYRPYHPAVLRGLAKTARAAKKQKKELSVCGEMAHETDYIPFLLGIGIRSLSVYPGFLPGIQKFIASLRLSDAETFAKRLLSETTVTGVRKALDEMEF
ncbi:MAG: phosphoenolpyruvate--protein phosphotransferase [Desulfobacterales bacterium]|jgi:phosphotransferase system enzyme I (PtsP)